MIYRDKILGEGLKATVTNLAEIREYGKNTNLITRKLTAAEWKEALYLMRMHQMIDLPGAVRDVEDHTPIYIYGTVNLYCTSADIRDLVEKYRESFRKSRTCRTRKRRKTLKQGEEDIYPDVINNWGGISHKVLEFPRIRQSVQRQERIWEIYGHGRDPGDPVWKPVSVFPE